MRTIAALALAALLSGCHHSCRWHSHGACIAVEDESVVTDHAWDHDDWQSMIDTTIENGITYWNSGGIDGWTVVLHSGAPSCFLGLITGPGGCTDPFVGEIHINAGDDCPLVRLPHEIGHAVLPGGDPFHWAGGWETLERNRYTVAQCEPPPDPEAATSTL